MKKCPQCGREYQDTTTLCPSDGTVLKKESDLVGQTLAGKYRIDEFLSEGGMGTVYRATHVLMDKTVAIKVLHPALAADDTIVARFSREAKAASRISHPHALNVTDFGEDENGIVFLVMEFLNGRTLKEIVRSEGPMSLPRVVEIMRQVCGALEAAHAENVVHRDLKSDNIMLIDVGGGDWVKVLDFGIAKIQEPAGQDPELTAPNLIIGTPQYMSPEQCSQASEIDSRSDIYSLGVILYEMLAGHVPFAGESPTAIMMKHLQDEPPNISDERRDLPREVSQVVRKALAKRPEDRFQTASELSENLSLAAEKEVTSENVIGDATERIERDTHRIVVPTGNNEPPRHTLGDDDDEATVVRPSPAVVTSHEEYEEDAILAPTPPPAASSNSWKMAVIALIGVIVIGGVLYALTSRRQSAEEQQTPPLTVDPNGQPVQPAPPPTGRNEQGITPNAPVTSGNLNTNTSATGSTQQNQNSELPPVNGNANNNSGNDNSSQQNNNSAGDNHPPPSTNANGNTNSSQGSETPPAPRTTPTKSEGVDLPPPPPLPSPTKKPAPKPSAQSDGGTASSEAP
ncbi:MAG: protein kinase [Acidobacteria bacterium]|nr:protein kinase [Acidobacteriota bacterium]